LLSPTEDKEKLSAAAPKESPAPRAKRRRHRPLKVANQLSQKRRKEIEKALGSKKSSTPRKWSRGVGSKPHLFDRKRIKPASVRKVDFRLLDGQFQ
jgi:hypothetical protein